MHNSLANNDLNGVNANIAEIPLHRGNVHHIVIETLFRREFQIHIHVGTMRFVSLVSGLAANGGC